MQENTPERRLEDKVYKLPNGKEWRVPGGILQADEHFQKLLPTLLEQHDMQWICVSSDGNYFIADTKDEAEIAGCDAGFDSKNYVVRIISPWSIHEDGDDEIEVYLMQCNSKMLSMIS